MFSRSRFGVIRSVAQKHFEIIGEKYIHIGGIQARKKNFDLTYVSRYKSSVNEGFTAHLNRVLVNTDIRNY